MNKPRGLSEGNALYFGKHAVVEFQGIREEIASKVGAAMEFMQALLFGESSIDWGEVLSTTLFFFAIFFGYLIFSFATAVLVVRINKRSRVSMLIRSNFFVFPCVPVMLVVLLAYSPLTLTKSVSHHGYKALKTSFEHASGAPLLQKRLAHYTHGHTTVRSTEKTKVEGVQLEES